MNYTIAMMESTIHSGLKVTLDIDNHGTICYTNIETGERTFGKFGSIKEAYPIYERLSRAIIFGEYSDADRKASLTSGLVLLTEEERRKKLNERLKQNMIIIKQKY